MLRTQEFARDEFPVDHVFAVPITPLIRREKVIFAFEERNHRIGGCAVFALGDEIWNRAIPVIDVDWVAIGFLLGDGRFRRECH